MNQAPQEFDDYAAEYDAGMDNAVKGLLGDSADAYIGVKLNWLLRRFPDLRDKASDFRLLDYGCGAATMLRLIAEADLHLDLSGCDISSGMLQEASRRWPDSTPRPDLQVQNGARTPYVDGAFDLILISAVLHHVLPEDRPDVYAELYRVARSGAHLVVFEHNPLNPVTRYVVAHTPIDRNAILLRAAEVTSSLSQAGFRDVNTGYLMFFPPRLGTLAGLEPALSWLPLGAQYAVVGHKQ
jgi:ubiquinone/menaquinone biosynthesis C-methylase UbiE